ncbi:MAG: hypothetical protein PHG66_04615 [Candidatus Colwellbacteria bacterium]|nr:hypothetical protein [Candidatus Colwellbacteria bacterium]
MSDFSSNRVYNENGSGNVEYNSMNFQNYLNSGSIPTPKYIGSLGDICENKSQCHEKLYCYSGVCSHWNPFDDQFQDRSVTVYKSDSDLVQMCTYREDCPGGWVCVNQTCQMPVPASQREGFKTRSVPQNMSRQPMYTSKRKANSGRNFYLYDETK